MATAEAQVNVNTNLQKQDLSNLHVGNLTPLSPEVISRQATINIGTIGHVAHGKSTVVKAISGVQTVRFKNELERNITIKLERLSEKKIEKLLHSKELRKNHEQKQRVFINRLAKQREINRLAKQREINRLAKQRETTNRQKSLELPHAHVFASNRRSRRSTSQTSLSPSHSSGYGSCLGADEQDALTTTSSSITDLQKSCTSLSRLKRRRSSKDSRNTLSPALKRTKGEHFVECIERVEVVHRDEPIFFVKWLGYDTSKNTWESFANLADCAALEHFVENKMLSYEHYIEQINSELEIKLLTAATLELNSNTIKDVDNYEPLPLHLDLILLAQFRASGSRSQREPKLIEERALRRLQLQRYQFQRRKQLEALAKYEACMNIVESPAPPIRVENNVDLDTLDESFIYIQKNKFNDAVPQPEPGLFGCSCDHNQCHATSRCCARLAGELFAYERGTRRLRLPKGSAIYECNSKCTCDKDCANRLVQHGRKHPLELFKTNNDRGWGVRTPKPLRKGEFVCEYVGEIITTDEANERGKVYDDNGRTYLFDLDYNTAAVSEYTIDAANYGNISHYINHSCNPNLAVFPCWIEHLNLALPQLVFFTLRPIKAGEELSFDYIRADNEDIPYENLSTAARVECRCGANNCRKVLF